MLSGPGELRQVKEKDVDVEAGYITITKPKEKGIKHVPMRKEDVSLVLEMQRGFPEAYFFRHPAGIKHRMEGPPIRKEMDLHLLEACLHQSGY